MLREVRIPDKVKAAALFPHVDLPEPPPDHPYRQVQRDGYMVGLFPGLTYGSVSVRAIGADSVEQTVKDARGVLAEDGKSRGAWVIADAASPGGLAESLRGYGMVSAEEPPFESRVAAMALVSPPEGGGDVEARPPKNFEEFQARVLLEAEVFGVGGEDLAAAQAQEQRLWEMEQQGTSPVRYFIALVEGEVVGGAAVVLGANAGFMSGGYTRADMRGRGVYRALVRARWEAVVAAGIPALTVTAGQMSRPILERLGFQTVGWVDCLLDDFG
jgi:GNAT superfamily N-acetyltransferase